MLDILQTRLQDLGRDIKTATAVISEDTDNPLWTWAEKKGVWREAHPRDVGGRFSALSVVGLVPAAFARVKPNDLREGPERRSLILNLCAISRRFISKVSKRQENISVFWFYIESLQHFGPWLEQLWAESLGKKMKGKIKAASTPLILSGTGDQHSVLQQLVDDNIRRSICFVRTLEHEHMGPTLTGEGLDGFSYLKGQNLGHVFAVQSKSTEDALRKPNELRPVSKSNA